MISTLLFSSILSKPEIHAVKDQRGARMFALHNQLLFADYVQN
jgi:hypothetical protein